MSDTAPGVDVSAWTPLGYTTYGFAVCKPEEPAPHVEPCIYCLRNNYLGGTE
jgi:hypothetical protein